MGRIKKVAGPKHEATISPALSSFVQKSIDIPLVELPTHLSSFPRRWPFPRGDLYHWIGVLNRFDDILALVIEKYALNNGPQVKPFGRSVLLESCASSDAHGDKEAGLDKLGFGPEGDRELVEVILDFSRLLLDKCGNRSLFSSSERLSDLLNTTSLSLLQGTLRLGVCLAQRYHSRQRSTSSSHFHQSLLAAHYNIDLDKVQTLAAPFSRPSQVSKDLDPSSPATSVKGKEKALPGAHTRRGSITKTNANDLISLTRDGTEANGNAPGGSGGGNQEWEEWGHVRVSYYPTTSPDQTKSGTSDGPSSGMHGQAPSTPSPAQRPARPHRVPSSDESAATSIQSPAGKTEEALRGMKILEIPNSKIASSKIEQILDSNLSELPYESIYELLHKLRVAKALTQSSETRREMLSIRILAITNLAYIYPDNIFQQKILHQDSDEPKRLQISYQLAELVHLGVSGDINAPTIVQIFALNALDALAKQKSRSGDVCAALNVNVNHGILMFIIRKAVADLGIEDDPKDSGEGDDWRDALFALLRTLPGSSTRTPETLVSAGLIPMLVEVLNLRTEKARRVIPRVMEFLDTFVHAVRDALTTLATAKGLDAISDLISSEVQSSFDKVSQGEGIPTEYKTPTIDYQIPYFQQQTLRWLFKFVNHIMQHNGGGFDRLIRNFIDSPPLLGALRLVFENAPIFGSHVWSGAVNILSSFIHNEPTSYQVIAEACLSKSFLEAVMHQTLNVPEKTESPSEEAGESSETAPSASEPAPTEPPKRTHELLRPENVNLAGGIMPATEAIGCIPQAFGAICLNSGGLELFKSSNALESFFEIFESPEHVKCMKNDANLLRVLGGSFDELVRHHPALKSAVMSAVLVMVARVSLLCKSKAWECGLGTKLWIEDKDGKQSVAGGRSSLLGEVGVDFEQHTEDPPVTVPETKDIDLPSGNKLANGSSGQFSGPKYDTPNEKDQDKHGLTVANYMYPVMKFLGAFFDNQTICTYFIEAGGVEFVLDYATLQSLPFDFHNNAACPELAQVIHLMAETKPHLVLPSLVKRTQTAVDKLEEFWGESRSSGFFSSLARPDMSESSDQTDGVKTKGTYFAKHLVTVHTLMDILREVFTPPIYPTRPSQQVSPFIQVNMADMYTSLVRRLGLLHASCVWEEILLQKGMPESWNEATKRQGTENRSSESSIPGSSGMFDPPAVDPAAPASAVGPNAPTSGNNEQPGTEPSTSAASSENGAAFKNVQTLRYLLSSLPLSITEFLHILGHGLVSKRRMESYQRQCSTMVADAIASTVLEQLDLDAAKNNGCLQDRFSYLIVILSSFSKLLFETTAERPHAHCLTMILFSFKRLNGLQVMKGLFELFLNEIKDLDPKAQKEDEPQDAPARRASAYGAIKIILTFFSEITSAGYIMNSSQTQAMTSSERDRDRPDYFQPAQFLVELRMEVLPVVRKMWGSEFIDQSSSSIVKGLIEILRSILEGEHEAGAFKKSDTIPALTALPKKPFPMLRDRYVSLKEKGYERALAREALYRCNNGAVTSEEYCKAQNGLRAPPRAPMPSNELESSPASSGTPQTEAPGSSSASARAQAPAGDTASPNQPREDAIASLLGAIQAAHPNVAGEESQPGQSSGVPAPADNTSADDGANSSSHLAMSIDNLLNDQEGPRSQDQESSTERASGTAPAPKSEPAKSREVVTIEDLDKGRDEIRSDLIECCLDVLNVHHDVTFELSDLILAGTKKLDSPYTFRKEVGETLVQSLISLQMEEDFELVGKKIAAYANLLALVLQDRPIYEVTLEELKDNFSTLLGFIKVSANVPSDKTAEPSSPWVGQVLLVLEKVLSDDAQPQMIHWTPPSLDDPNPGQPIAETPEPVVPMEEKKRLFEAIVDILPRIGKDVSLALSVSRVLVILTRNREIATQLGEKRNLQRLFVMMKQLSGSANEKLQSTFMLILRHIVEDDETIRQIMRTEIVSVFDSRPARQTDTAAYIRQLHHLALRSPQLFVEVTNEKLKLTRYESNQRPQGLMLKVDKDDSSKDTGEKESEDAGKEEEDVVPTSETVDKETKEKPKGPELKTPVVEKPDGVIHYLLSELLSYKDVDDKEPTPDPSDKPSAQPDAQGDIEMSSGEASTAPTSNLPSSRTKKADKPQFKADEHPIYIYRCFLLQCLTELLSSYNRTKVEFINFSRKADPMAATPSKPRAGILNYLLNAVIPVGTLEHDDSIAFKKRNKTSDWAMQVVVALCTKTGEFGVSNSRRRNAIEDESEPDLLFIRKFVLEHTLKSYRDANASTEPLGVKYARLMCLADLFDKMLSGGSSPDRPSHLPSSTKQVAKTMFEKNFISAFTASIADIDLNFPSAKRAVKYILRPLNKLAQTAVVLSESSSIQTTPGQTDEDEISSATSVSDVDNEREETPDLFRHSTLGMFDPNQEEGSSSEGSDNEDDDEMYDDEYGDDMDYDEELAENDGEVVSDEDEEIGPGRIEGLPGDSGMDIEVLIEGDEDGEDEDDEDDDEDDDDEEDEDSDMDEDEIMAGEITGDNPDHLDHEDDWESDDMTEDPEAAEMMNRLENEFDAMPQGGDPNDRPRFENLLRVLEEAGGGIEHIDDEFDMGDGLQGEMVEDDMNEDEEDEEEVDELEEELDELEDDQGSYHEFDDDEPDLGNPPLYMQDPIAPRVNQRFRGVPPPPWTIGMPNRHGVVPIPPYRSQRAQIPPRGGDDGTNPLLIRNDRPGDAPRQGRGANTEAFSDWVHAIDPSAQGRLLSVDSPVSFMNAIMQAMGQGGAGFGVVSRPDGFHVHLDRRSGLPNRIQQLFGIPAPQTATQPSRDDPSQVVTFAYGSTISRWQEETRILYGNAYHDKALRIHNSLLRVLVPPAIEEEKVRRKEREEEQKRREEEQAERERIAKEEAEKEKKRKEEEEAALERQRELEREAEAEAQSEAVEEPSGAEPMDDVQPTQPSAEAPATGGETTESGPSEPTARVRTTIRGRQLDITGMDIDPEYLEALPEEIREEVIMQQLAQQRTQAAASGEEPSEINPEFLEALPPEIREELLQQEAADRRRRERENARRQAASTDSPAHAEDMDPASFIATLDPSLRQAVLADQPEEVLASLGPEYVSEARALTGGRRIPQFNGVGSGLDPRSRPEGPPRDREQSTKKPERKQIVQMLDKAGVATLLRLMFMPLQGNARHHLNDILHNVCKNRQTRAEVVGLLLLILQDGSADVSAIERSFAHLSLRAKTPASQKTPQPLKRTLSLQSTSGANSDVTPLMVVHQCLVTLSFLTQYNPHIAWFFLSEHENNSALKLRAIRKGKGKENRANKFALNALLSLLDRKLIMESPNCMEQLSSLLASITQPLTILLRKEKEKQQEEESKPKEGESSSATGTAEDQSAQAAGAATSGEATAASDTTMTDAPAETRPEEQSAEGQTGEGTGEGQAEPSKPEEEQKSRKPRTIEPPVVPEHNLRLVVHILSARECNGKTFRETLSTINNLSAIPGAKEIIGKELIHQAQGLSQSILVDLDDLLPHIHNAQTGTDVQGMALSKFSPASSDQSKLLRVLTALDYLFDPNRVDKDKGAEPQPSDKKEEVLKSLYESSKFNPLWHKLSECLTAIRKKEKMLNVATILLPLIEALMVVCKNTTLKDVPISKHGRDFTVSSPPPESSSGMEGLFFNFTEEHRKVLNELVRQNPKLMSGTFSLLVKNPKVLEFDNKRNYFSRRLHSRGAETRHPHPPLQLSVRRDQVFLDSFKSLYFKSADEMKYGKLNIRFHGEEGVDAGGVSREWFQVLARGMFNPNYALFIPVASDRTTFHPNRLSGVNQEHLMFFKFIGRIIGKALYEGRVLDCHFSRAVYKRILGKSVSIKDMETLDLDYYKSLLWMLENDITDIITENFAVETDDFGEKQVIDLIEGGRHIPVTQENKEEYVQRVVEYRLTGSVKEQLDNFLKGFHDIVPAELISIFSEQELELLISGLPEIDVDDWRNNSEYHNYSASSSQIQWFWRAVRSFDKEERAKLLQFVSGTSKVPLNGFKELEGMNGFSKFNIHRDYGDKERLPSSHTCFNQLDLPEYDSYEVLRERLYTAMTAGGEYFGFA